MNECGAKTFQYAHAFGCMPDVNLVGNESKIEREELVELGEKLTYRPAGGHIQLSGINLFTEEPLMWAALVRTFRIFQKETDKSVRDKLETLMRESKIWQAIKDKLTVLEAVMLLVSTRASLVYARSWFNIEREELLQMERDRRKLYGQAGSARIKLFNNGVDDKGNRVKGVFQGIEIRSPSPAWILIPHDSPAVAHIEALMMQIIRGEFTAQDVATATAILRTTDEHPENHTSEKFMKSNGGSSLFTNLVKYLRYNISVIDKNAVTQLLAKATATVYDSPYTINDGRGTFVSSMSVSSLRSAAKSLGAL